MKRRELLKTMAIISALISLSVVLSLFDRQISQAIMSAIPALGMVVLNFKLGLANVVILIILYNYGFKYSLLAVVLKVAILGLFNPSGLPMSFGGSLLSFFVMYLLIKVLVKPKYIFFVSMVGGFAHSLGQIIVGFAYYGIFSMGEGSSFLQKILLYSPFMLLAGLLTGLLMGFVAKSVNKFLNEQHIIIKQEKKMKTKVIYVAHRGSKVNGGVENTKEAYLGGVKAGFKGSECDVRVTSDGVFIIHHDNNLVRLTEHSLKQSDLDVNKANYVEISNIELTQEYDDVVHHGKICLFEEYLDICKQNRVIPIIELKWTNGMFSSNTDESIFDYSNLDRLVNIIKSKNLYDTAYVMTSMRGCLQYLRDNYPDLKLQWLCSDNVLEHVDWCIENKISVDVQFESCTSELVEKCHNNGLVVNIWTLNNRELLSRYLDMGVDMITSDRINK